MNPPTEPESPALSATETLAAEAEVSAQTPPTRLLKRGDTPLFVPVTLPDEAPEAASAPQIAPEVAVEAPPAPQNAPEVAVEAASAPQIAPDIVAAVAEAAPPEPSPLQIVFSPPPDAAHSASVTLRLSCAVPDASIRYALDAADVAETGALYDPTAPLFLTASTAVAARAWHDGQAGPLALARYQIARPQWQKVEPSDQSDATLHEISDEAALEGPWRLAAASVRGKLHAHRGGWREDAYRHGLAPAVDGTYSVVVVSDGAGSAPLSRVGSNLLCQTALDYLTATLSQSAPLSNDPAEFKSRDLPLLRGHLVEAARLALQTLREEATRRNRPLSDFAATFLCLVRREWNGAQLCAALQAGDGGIALWNDDGTVTILGEADHGAQSGETRFLISSGMEAELPARVKFSIRPRLRAVAVFTDGISDDYFPETERYPELFRTVLPLVEGQNALPPGAALLDWIDYDKKGSADDRALVLCWRAPLSNDQPLSSEESVATSNPSSDASNLRSDSRGTQSDASGLQSATVGTQSDASNLQSDVPGLRSATVGTQSEASGLQSEASGLQSALPDSQVAAPATAAENL